MADYVTTTQVSSFAQEFAALDVPGQDLLVTSASRLFDSLCEVDADFFSVPIDVFPARNFYGEGTRYLRLDPFTELNPVDPVNGTTDIPSYDIIDNWLVSNDGSEWTVRAKFTVSANWGFAAIPQDVQIAVIHLSLYLWRTGDPAFTVISAADGTTNRPMTIPQITQSAIKKYREMYSRRAMFA